MNAEELMTGKAAVLDQAALERKMTGAPDAIDQGAIDQAGFWGQTRSVARDLTGQVVGIAATAVDMLAVVPRVLSIPGSWAIGTAALVKGESSRTAAGAALAYQQQFLPDWMQGAWGKIATAMGPQAEEYYKTNQLAKLMDLLNSGIDKAGKIGEKAGLPEDYIHLIAGQTMDLLGAAGVKVSLGKSMGARAEAAKDAVMARQYVPYERTPQEKFLAENPQRTPDPAAKPQGAAGLAALKEAEARMAAWNKANPQFRQQDASLFMQDVVEAGRASGAAEVARRNWAEAQAAEAARARSQADFEAQMTGAKPPPGASPAGGFPAARDVGQWTPREATPEGRPLTELISERDFSQSSLGQGLAKVKEGKLWDLTAEERIALKGRQRELDTLREAGKAAPLRDVRGAVDPELLNWMVAGTALATAAWNKYKEWEATQDYPENEKPTPYPSDMTPGGRPLFTADASDLMKGLGGAAAMAAAGWIKAPGGMWHPEAILRLGAPLKNKLIGREEAVIEQLQRTGKVRPEASEAELWKAYDEHVKKLEPRLDIMISGYLNKFAGTERDPLKDVQVPFGEGTVAWEKLTDAAIQSTPAKEYAAAGDRRNPTVRQQQDMVKGVPPEEPIYDLSALARPEGVPEIYDTGRIGEGRALNALTSYLSHVGDYLAQSAEFARDPSRFDLVRAVKETAKWDEQLAKNMAKARLAEKSVSPVPREYPDGSYWQQLTKPGQFARESDAMGHSVRGYEPPKSAGEMRPSYEVRAELARELNRTPTNAEIVARQDRDFRHPDWIEASGNAGHPSYGVGGWDAIKSGNAKIYSLRDAMGESHVTIEVGPGKAPDSVIYAIQARAAELAKQRGATSRNSYWEPIYELQDWEQASKEINPERPSDILQIKGKQNRAPAGKYLAAVQDFIRNPPEGKAWKEVGDVENAGLVDLNNIGTFSSATKVKELQRIIQEQGRYVTKDVLEKLFNSTDHPSGEGTVYWPRERGSADPRLLAGIAAAGGLAAYLAQNPDDSEAVAALGLGGIALKGKHGIKSAGEVFTLLDTVLGRSTTRLANMHPSVTLSVRGMELERAQEIGKASEKLDNFTKATKVLSKEQRVELERAYLKGDQHEVATIIKGHPALVGAYREIRNWIDDMGKTLEEFGRFKKGITSHLPRVVKDFEGLMATWDKEVKVGFEKMLAEANIKSLRTRERELSDVEKSVLLNNWLQSESSISHLPGFAKARRVQMTDELQPFYYSMEEGLARYIHASIEDVAKTRFFGKDLKTSNEGGKKFTNVEESIGALTGRLLDEGKLTPEQAVEMQGILRDRFGGGEQSPHWALQDARNVTGLLTLAQIGSGVVQTTEALLSGYHHGAVPTLRAVGTMLTGRGIKPKEFGQAQHVIEEVIGKRLTGKALSIALKANLLTMFDQLGMKTNLTASFIKNKQLVQTPKGIATLAEKWGPAFGESFPELVQDLQKSTMSKRGPLTDLLTWAELSDIRPTSMIETPQVFMGHPNARLIWQLKQFMITQGDIIRRDAYNKIKTGDPKQVAIGFKNLTLYATAMSLALVPINAVKEFISGRDWDIKDENLVLNFMQNFGLNRYTVDKITNSTAPVKAGIEVAENMAMPPVVSVAKQVGTAISKPERFVPFVPIAGRVIYDREFGGNQKKARIKMLQERIKQRDADEERNPGKKAARLKRMRDRELKQLGQQP